jgi:predicted ATPase
MANGSSEITKIRDQFLAGQWPQYLESVNITGLRSWQGQGVQFNFPVVAIVGENGTGKSTVLKAAAAAYESKYFPSDFFLTTHWDKVEKIDLNYRIKLGASNPLPFSIKKKSERWSYPDKRYKRPVFWFDVSRTLPLDATAGYAKVAKLAAGESSTEDMSEEFRAQLSYILGRDYKSARFAKPDVNDKRPVGLLKRDFGEISQFHQGAGEDTTMDLLHALQAVPNYALILIDEVEASLHPRAQRRLLRFLLELSRTKRLQIILSTHSPYVLEELPPEGRALLLPSTTGPNVIYSASSAFALTKIDDAAHPELDIYVEDPSAQIWLREILAKHPGGATILSRVRIVPVGPANVVQIMGKLGFDKKLPGRGLGVVDGDTLATPGCICLPGTEAPEKVVFSELKQKNWSNLHERFGIGAGDLHTHLDDATLDGDFHRWPTLVGDKILKSGRSVWEVLTTEWCRVCLDPAELTRICDAVVGALEAAHP